MHDGIHALGDAQRVGHLRDVRAHERRILRRLARPLVRAHEALSLRRLERPLVREPHIVRVRELAAEMRADVAGRARDQYRLHTNLPSAALNCAARSKYTEWPDAGTRSASPFGAKDANSGPAIGGKTQSSSPVMKSTGIDSSASSAGGRMRSSPSRWRTSSRNVPSANSMICQ